VQAFVSFQADYAAWKTMLTPVDVNRLDLEQAFVVLTEPVGGGTLKQPAGRRPQLRWSRHPLRLRRGRRAR
jgi:hypothetical protein